MVNFNWETFCTTSKNSYLKFSHWSFIILEPEYFIDSIKNENLEKFHCGDDKKIILLYEILSSSIILMGDTTLFFCYTFLYMSHIRTTQLLYTY